MYKFSREIWCPTQIFKTEFVELPCPTWDLYAFYLAYEAPQSIDLNVLSFEKLWLRVKRERL